LQHRDLLFSLTPFERQRSRPKKNAITCPSSSSHPASLFPDGTPSFFVRKSPPRPVVVCRVGPFPSPIVKKMFPPTRNSPYYTENGHRALRSLVLPPPFPKKRRNLKKGLFSPSSLPGGFRTLSRPTTFPNMTGFFRAPCRSTLAKNGPPQMVLLFAGTIFFFFPGPDVGSHFFTQPLQTLVVLPRHQQSAPF